MIKRIAAALLALCLVLPLAACGQGGELELNIDELGEELYSVGTFGEELYALDESVAQGLYGTDADTRCWVRAGTGATAEELAVFETKDADAAAALVQMMGGTPEQALDASSIALSNLLGLVCDPVGGLVEVPCQNRNAIGVAAAFSSAQLALAGIKSLVPFDQMAHVMLSVGHALPATLRETAKGGIAQAPAALSACEKCGICG